jgi:hypothetical protein
MVILANKMAYVSVTYLYSFEPSELGLNDNCSNNVFFAAVKKHMDEELATMPIPSDDIEIIIDEV